jgi:drug/metabolite transporter (DMT)-like permease
MVAFSAQIGGWLAINHAQVNLRASIVAPRTLGQPIVTAILAVPMLGKPSTAAQFVGGLIVCSVWLVNRASLQ